MDFSLSFSLWLCLRVATLKTQTVWFMAAGSYGDQRSVSCWVGTWSTPTEAPLPSLPGTQHRARPPGLSRECQESSQPICSLLCTFSPSWGCKECRRVRGKSPRSKQETGEEESESSWMELLSPSQHNKDPIIYFCHSPCRMKSNPTTQSLIKGSDWLSWRVTNKYECQEWSRRICGPDVLGDHFISINDMHRQVMSAVSGSQSIHCHNHLNLRLTTIFSKVLENYKSCDQSLALLVKCRDSKRFVIDYCCCFCQKFRWLVTYLRRIC